MLLLERHSGPVPDAFAPSLYVVNLTERVSALPKARRDESGAYSRSHRIRHVVAPLTSHQNPLKHCMDAALRNTSMSVGNVSVWKVLRS
jgi:hypothetical protein